MLILFCHMLRCADPQLFVSQLYSPFGSSVTNGAATDSQRSVCRQICAISDLTTSLTDWLVHSRWLCFSRAGFHPVSATEQCVALRNQYQAWIDFFFFFLIKPHHFVRVVQMIQKHVLYEHSRFSFCQVFCPDLDLKRKTVWILNHVYCS